MIAAYLYDYRTGERLRVATSAELAESTTAAQLDGGRGVIEVEDHDGPVYAA
tara:strand:- start:57 stop:212 length:156 start_codon:yes stop_codon:yes gene_type:complete